MNTSPRPTSALRLIGLLAFAISLASCGRVDATKFDAVYRAGKALDQEISAGASPRAVERLAAFRAEVFALEGQVKKFSEVSALLSYRQALTAFEHFLMFQDLHVGSADGRVEVTEQTEEVAWRYALKVEGRDDSEWTDGKTALERILSTARRQLEAGDRLVHGG